MNKQPHTPYNILKGPWFTLSSIFFNFVFQFTGTFKDVCSILLTVPYAKGYYLDLANTPSCIQPSPRLRSVSFRDSGERYAFNFILFLLLHITFPFLPFLPYCRPLLLFPLFLTSFSLPSPLTFLFLFTLTPSLLSIYFLKGTVSPDYKWLDMIYNKSPWLGHVTPDI